MNQNEFFEALGYLSSPQRNCKLDAEMHLGSQTRFESEYSHLTGIIPVADYHNYYILHEGADKWGVELRIYFDSNEASIPQIIRNMVRSSRPGEPRNSRINDNKLIWKFIEHGFLLNDLQDIARIRSKIPAQFLANFERGFSL